MSLKGKLLSIGNRILTGGAYAKQQEKRINKTPEGRESLASLKRDGFIKTYLKYRKKKKEWGL